MNGLAVVASAARTLRSLPAALSIAVFGLMVPYTSASASPLHLPPPTPEPTELTTTLATSTLSGPTIAVTEGPRVRDAATLTGPNAASAHGHVTYSLYSDSACSQEIGPRGGSGVRFGSIDPSQGARLPAGTYYWQASYSGDARDLPSVSPCEAETVTPFIPWECSSISGKARDMTEGERGATEFSLSTDLAARHQRFAMQWEGGQRVRLVKLQSASCWVRMHAAVFHATGTAALDGARGYLLSLTILVSDTGTTRVVAAVREGEEPLVRDLQLASADETTVLAGGLSVDLPALL